MNIKRLIKQTKSHHQCYSNSRVEYHSIVPHSPQILPTNPMAEGPQNHLYDDLINMGNGDITA